MLIGDKIRKIRDLRGMKQEEVAEKLGITPQAYGKVERNETRLDVGRLQQIADIFGISKEDLENFDEKKVFVNDLKECHNSQGTALVINNYNLTNHYNDNTELLEKIIAQQREEIEFLREQVRRLTQGEK